MATTGINMFRARDGVELIDELIPGREDRDYLEQADFRLADGSVALVYYRSSPAKPPRWAPFFNGIIDPDELRNASASAVVAFMRDGRWYLVTFGYARYLINFDAPDFFGQ